MHLLLLVLCSLLGLVACEGGSQQTRATYDEHAKSGDLSLMIVGDYFHPNYVLELARITDALSPRARQVVFCTEHYRQALVPFLEANGITNVEYHTAPEGSPLLTQWARDVAVAGTEEGGVTIVVSPDKHAASREAAEATGAHLRRALPRYDVRVAPFVFEGGNLVFVRSGEKRVLIVGRKVLFDNEVYQRRAWAGGHTGESLLAVIAETFAVDDVIVLGRVDARPETRMYFEYHIDMGMAVFDGGRAVVSRLRFGAGERDALEEAIRDDHIRLTSFDDTDAEALLRALTRRLESVSLEYEDYASVLDSLGLDVYRTPVTWRHVLSSMSWTNVAQVGNTILMPLYPDTLRGFTTSTGSSGGQVRRTLDVSDVEEETFAFTGQNEFNRRLYQGFGYRVVGIPEYLHYMMGGVHCFVNVLD